MIITVVLVGIVCGVGGYCLWCWWVLFVELVSITCRIGVYCLWSVLYGIIYGIYVGNIVFWLFFLL